jgi:tetratricopeptide (TPR) repeat protein
MTTSRSIGFRCLIDHPCPSFDFRSPPTTWQAALETLATHAGQIKLFLYLTPLAIVSLVYYSLYIKADEQRRIKESVAENSAYTASSFIYGIFGRAARQIEMPPELKKSLLSEAKNLLTELAGIGTAVEIVRRRGLAAVLIEQSALAESKGNASEAGRDALAAIEILTQLSSTEPVAAEVQFDLATAYDRLGDSLIGKEQHKSAFDAFKRSQDILQALLPLEIPSEKLKGNLTATTEKLANLYVDFRLLPEAEALFRSSCKVHSELSLEKGRSDLRLNVARCHKQIGQVLMMQQKYQAASIELDAAMDINKQAPRTTAALLDLAETYQRVGDLRERMDEGQSNNDMGKWEHYFRQAFEITKTVRSVESNRAEVASAYASAVINLGFLLTKTNRSKDAVPLYEDASEYIGTAFEEVPDLIRLRARIMTAMGDAERNAENLLGAREKYALAAKLLEGLSTAFIAPTLWRRDLMDVYRRGASASFNICEYPHVPTSACVRSEAWDLARRRTELAFLEPLALPSSIADVLGEESWYALFADRVSAALSKSEQALGLLPSPVPIDFEWIKVNYAHALMLSERIDEARAIYNEEMRKPKQMTDIRRDFAIMRKHQICHSLMIEIDGESPPCNLHGAIQ